MKNFFLIIFGLSLTNCFSQNSYKLRKDELWSIEKIDEFVDKSIDSLNSYSCNNCTELPSFFYQNNYDRENKIGWLGFHHATSLRKLIIDKIENEFLLYAVLKNKDKRLRKSTKIPKKHYMGQVTIPFQEYSTYELVKYRLQELMNEENMGKRATNYPFKNN